MKCVDCRVCYGRVGWIGLAVSIFVGSFTLFIGILNGSKALIAASLCCGIDVATALTVLLGLKLSGKNIDLEHPYGHGKVEFLVVGGISVLLILSAIFLFFHSAKSIFHGDLGPSQPLTLVAALVAAIVNELKYRYANCVAKHFNSPALESHAEHARVDAISFMAVALAVLCAMIGLHFVDPLIAIFETGHVLKTSIKMLINSVTSLMDVSVPEDKKNEIRQIVDIVSGVQGVSYLNARRIGQHVWVELAVFVDPNISVHDGKLIASNVKMNLLDQLAHVGSVQVQFMGQAS